MLLTIFILIVFIFAVTYAYAGFRAAPWVPTFNLDVKRTFDLIDINKDAIFMDLGSGHGNILRAAASKGAKAIGYEISLFPYLLSLFINFLHPKRKNIKVIYKDFWFANLSNADIVYVFLREKVLKRLKMKLEKELKKGCVVISHVFEIPGWEPLIFDEKPGHPPIYIYKI